MKRNSKKKEGAAEAGVSPTATAGGPAISTKREGAARSTRRNNDSKSVDGIESRSSDAARGPITSKSEVDLRPSPAVQRSRGSRESNASTGGGLIKPPSGATPATSELASANHGAGTISEQKTAKGTKKVTSLSSLPSVNDSLSQRSTPAELQALDPGRTLAEKVQAGRIADAGLEQSALLAGTSTPCAKCEPLIKFRPYQLPVFLDRTSGILILHWSRQIGKSFTLASWAVDRLLTQLQKNPTWLITVLSNSRDNGAEFVLKCHEVCRLMGVAEVKLEEERALKIAEIGDAAVYVEEDQSPDLQYENMRMEVRILVNGRIGRIKVLAANPRTARGFSGDLILDEFAFHEDSNAIWEAAEPILSSNPEFVCRIASTGNGKHNMFYRMVTSGSFAVSRVSRTEAHRQGVKVYDPNTRQPITPEEARRKALDKRAYDQNYELTFNDENMALLTAELIQSAQRALIPIDEQEWTSTSLARMFRAEGELFVGVDVGRNRDISVVTVLEKVGNTKRVIGMLRMAGMRLPAQQRQIEPVCRLPKFRKLCGDMTGLGLGLIEYLQEAPGVGFTRVEGVNFSTTEPITERLRNDGRKAETAKVTEIMATDLLGCFEDRCIEIPADEELHADLRKPEKITSPGGKVSIAASRDDAGHADHFWSIALANRASLTLEVAGTIKSFGGKRGRVLAERRSREVAG